MKEKVHKIKEDNVAVNNSNHIDKQKQNLIESIIIQLPKATYENLHYISTLVKTLTRVD